jgi:diadenosine tetraphosphatase ApaH/serine/threonine PP2A family protein phosphatase
VRALVLSDLHANLEAFEAALADARRRGWDEVWVLGDLVGYGADPEEVVGRVRALDVVAIIRGNHDRTASGVSDAADFNAAARHAVEWTRGALSSDSLAYLRALPAGPLSAAPGIWVAHGTPADEDEYLLDEEAAEAQFAAGEFSLCFVGHSHIACSFSLAAGSVTRLLPPPADGLRLWPGERHLFNPGSVGQPRDRDPRAAYAILDTAAGRIEHYRVAYDVEAAARKILAAGLPGALARRLRTGT